MSEVVDAPLAAQVVVTGASVSPADALTPAELATLITVAEVQVVDGELVTVGDPTTIVDTSLGAASVDAAAAATTVDVTTLGDTVQVVEAPVEALDAALQGPQGAAGPQGPQGPAGPAGEEDVPYAKRVDFVGDTVVYRGEAAVGSVESAAVWRIRRFTFAPDGDVTEEWASGTDAFDKVWADRASLGYS